MNWNIDETLSKLLHPISVDEFYEKYFGKRNLYIPGEPGRFDEYFSEADWTTAPMVETTAVFQTRVDGIPASRAIQILPTQVVPFYEAGLLTVGRVDHLPQIARLIDGLRASLLFPSGKVSNIDKAICFASKDATGYQLHWDLHHNFILQIAGTKEWRCGDVPAVDWPVDGPRVAEAGQPCAEYDGRAVITPHLDDLARQLLNPGDFLYMPPGVWHAPIARGYSNHVTIALGHRPIYKLISDVLKEEIGQSPTLRRGFPSLRGLDRHSGAVPKVIMEIFDAAVDEIRERLANVDVRQFHKEWSLEVAEHHANHQEKRDVVVERGDRLSRPSPVPIRYSVGRADDDPNATEIFVYGGNGNYVSLPENARGFVEHLVAAEEFAAESALAWDLDYDWDQVQAGLSRFVSEGILRRTR